MAKNSQTTGAKKRVKVGALSARAKKLTTKDAKKVKGGIIAVLIGRAKKEPSE